MGLGCHLTNWQLRSPPHLTLLNKKLTDVAAGRIDRLLVLMPPRHGKSLLTSHYFPAWLIGNRPDARVILASYEADFAGSWGRAARDTLLLACQEGLFPDTEIRRDTLAARRWETTAGGGMICAGVGGAITGRGANVFLIDDPVKNQEEALSPTYRERAWDWYNSTATTRLEPGAAVILIMTRWHQADLGGRILSPEFSDPDEIACWDVVSLPAIAKEADPLGRRPGEPLWPWRYSKEALDRRKRQIGSYWWGALYEQEPTVREGGLFSESWFEVVDVDDLPEMEQLVRFWDLAATEKTRKGDPDFTAGALVGRSNGLFYVLDMKRFQLSSGKVEKRVKDTALTDGPGVAIIMEQEPGSSGKTVVDSYAHDVLQGFDFRGQPSTGSKEVRADPLARAAERGDIKVLRASWTHAFLEEFGGFGAGAAHDDQVDATSGAFNELALDDVFIQ
jgi:predicted phage terminase large subunit-like protein